MMQRLYADGTLWLVQKLQARQREFKKQQELEKEMATPTPTVTPKKTKKRR